MNEGGLELLVAGAQRVDAGKTTFSAGLIERASAVGFKPRAGNDHWFSHDDVRAATTAGRLFGKDAKTLADASPGQFEPEEINPIHRLWTPSPGPGSGLLGREDQEFVVDRVDDQYVVNATVEMPPHLREELPLGEALRVESLDAFNQVMERYHVPALQRAHETVAATDRAVVESYGDVARPLQSMSPDAVAVTEPRRVRIYDGSRYMQACDIATRSPRAGQLEERVQSVVDLINPEATLTLPPLAADQRSDPAAIATAYHEAYTQLLDVARSA